MKHLKASAWLNKSGRFLARITNEQIKRLNEARNKYEAVGEYDKLIAVYEDVFSVPSSWNAATHKLYLVGYYQKKGRTSKHGPY